MELHIAGQLRWTACLSALLPGMLPCLVLARAKDQARGQGFVVQAGTVGPSHRDEPSDRRGPLWWDTRPMSGLHPPFVHLVVASVVPRSVGPQTRSCTAMRWLVHLPQGPSLGTGL